LFQTFVDERSKDCAEKCKAWLEKQQLKRSELISISVSESKGENGDTVIAVVYRKDPNHTDTSMSSDLLSYQLTSGRKPWEELFTEGNKFCATREIVSICHQARNVADRHEQFIWYVDTQAKPKDTVTQKVFSGEKSGLKGWESLLHEATQWMNNFVRPHDLVSISMFEESHSKEEETGKCYFVVTHTSGATPRPLDEKDKPKDGIYMSHLESNSSLDDSINRSLDKVWERGSDSGVVVTHAIASYSDNQIVAAIYWDNLAAAKIEDSKRPTECSCSIF